MLIKILGGAGAVGMFVARDLLKNPRLEQVVLADLNEAAGRSAAASFGGRRVVWEKVDANDGQKGVLAPEACMVRRTFSRSSAMAAGSL